MSLIQFFSFAHFCAIVILMHLKFAFNFFVDIIACIEQMIFRTMGVKYFKEGQNQGCLLCG